MKAGEEYQCDRCKKRWIVEIKHVGPSSFNAKLEPQGMYDRSTSVSFRDLCKKCENEVGSLLHKIEFQDSPK